MAIAGMVLTEGCKYCDSAKAAKVYGHPQAHSVLAQMLLNAKSVVRTPAYLD